MTSAIFGAVIGLAIFLQQGSPVGLLIPMAMSTALVYFFMVIPQRKRQRQIQTMRDDLKEPTTLIQFTGQPLITATKYEREALRCAKRQQRYVASLPEGVVNERYDATCDATIALMRYGGGLPWHRQAGLQAMCGAPLGEATMWERCEATADAAMGIFLRLMSLAASGKVIHTDDTWVRILSCLKEDKEEKGRATNGHRRDRRPQKRHLGHLCQTGNLKRICNFPD